MKAKLIFDNDYKYYIEVFNYEKNMLGKDAFLLHQGALKTIYLFIDMLIGIIITIIAILLLKYLPVAKNGFIDFIRTLSSLLIYGSNVGNTIILKRDNTSSLMMNGIEDNLLDFLNKSFKEGKVFSLEIDGKTYSHCVFLCSITSCDSITIYSFT